MIDKHHYEKNRPYLSHCDSAYLKLRRCHRPLQHQSLRSAGVRRGGKTVMLFTLTNRNGMVIKVSSFGATLTYVSAPDMNGNFEPVVLGFDSLKMYVARHPNFGSTVGRYANRIGGAQFLLTVLCTS